jgi:signal transduction histidine kinase
MTGSRNRRIIIIDDNKAIHDDFRKVLTQSEGANPALNHLESDFFGGDQEGEGEGEGGGEDADLYEIDSALQGQEGYEIVKAAAETNNPFALAFVDMRMPPGWDGLKTIEYLWKVDPAIQVVICSAYSDHTWDEIDERLGFSDQLLSIRKPFDAVQIRQLAGSFTRRWSNQRSLAVKEQELQLLLNDRTREIETIRLAAEKTDRAREEFLANVNREIRAPMTAILGYAEVLLSNDGVRLQVSERIEGLEMIRQNGDQLLELLNEFLDLTRIEGGRLRLDSITFSPRSLLDEAISFMRARADEKELQLSLRLPGGLPQEIRSDPHRLRQILYVLLGNAVRFTARGSIELAVHRVQDESEVDFLQFDISDTGVGMPPEQLAEIFEPFSSSLAPAVSRYSGTGLGLSLTRKLSELLGGSVNVKSTLGEGTTFSVRIPCEMPIPKTEAHRPVCSTNLIPSLDCRLLLVEDNKSNQMLISMVLRKAGATIDIANNGQEAIDKVHSAGGVDNPYDLILMDLEMPILSGIEATRILRAEGFSRPIVALTACTSEEDRDRCLANGCDAFFTKPLDRHSLITTINELTTDKRPEIDEG